MAMVAQTQDVKTVEFYGVIHSIIHSINRESFNRSTENEQYKRIRFQSNKIRNAVGSNDPVLEHYYQLLLLLDGNDMEFLPIKGKVNS